MRLCRHVKEKGIDELIRDVKKSGLIILNINDMSNDPHCEFD